MTKKIYLSPERRLPPHGPFWGIPGMNEHRYCQALAERTAELLAQRGFIVRVAEQTQTIYQRVPDAAGWGADAYIALHTNASTDGKTEGKARGALLFAQDTDASRDLAERIYAGLTALSPSSRGVQTGSSFYEVKAPAMTAAYVEAAFHDNGEDAKYLTENTERIAEALCGAVCAWAGLPAPEAAADTLEQIAGLARQICALCSN